jgi:hypothetical protein
VARLILPDKQGFYFGELKTARKSYTCYLCGAEIRPGDKYVYRKPFWRDRGFQVCLKHFEESVEHG